MNPAAVYDLHAGHPLRLQVLDALAAPVYATASFTIYGELASKANQRRLVVIKNRAASIKSDKALQYEASALSQVPPKLRMRLQGDVRMIARLYYATERPDLDESLLLDCLQDRHETVRVPRGGGVIEEVRQLAQRGVYQNDRQVRQRFILHGIDKLRPRAEILIEALEPQQGALA
jgi:hypothetical protein